MTESPRPPWVTEVLQPASIPELADCVRKHNTGAIFPIGAGSWLDLGYRPFRTGVGISTLGLNRVVDYPHEELTITVEAGILISDLQRILAEKRQMLPFDCPHPHRATLGGLLATNTSGPRRLAYGTARDSVLGLDVIDATGQRIHGGGRVVKNVAGYDLPKMHIGALGTLGLIVEATIKVRPMPEHRAELSVGVPNDKLPQLLAAVRKSKLRPSAVEVEDLGDNRDRVGLAFFFEGDKEAVEFQLKVAQQLTNAWENRRFECEGDDVARSLCGLMEPLMLRFELCAKVSGRPTSVPELVGQLLAALPKDVCMLGHALNGVLWLFWDAGTLDMALKSTGTIGQLAAAFGCQFSIPRCPDDWKRSLPIWGDPGPELHWMQRLRDALDPNHVLNPGRFVVE